MKTYLLTLIMIAVLALSACSPAVVPNQDNTPTTPVEAQEGTYVPPTTDLSAQPELVSFSSIEEYEAFVQSQGSNNFFGRPTLTRGLAVDFAESAVAFEAVAEDSGVDESAKDYSETNNQVSGVDEADIIKTDGEYIYTVTGKTLFIVSSGEDAELINRVSFDGRVDGLFINNDKIAIFGSEYNDEVYDLIGFQPQSGMMYFHVYDMSDKENLELITEYSFEGGYFNARMIEDQIYFVTRSMPHVRPMPLPVFYEDGIARSLPVDRIMWYPGSYDSSQMITTHSIDLSGENDVDSLSIAVENAQNMYMSQNNMFIVGSEYINEYEIEQGIFREVVESELTAQDRELISLIESADNRLLSQYEKEQKIMSVYQQRVSFLSTKEQTAIAKEVDAQLAEELKKIEYFTYTTLLKISVDDGVISYQSSGRVPGRIVNQFSLDEYEDHLRVATTVDARWSRFGQESESYTNVFVVDNELDLVGELTGLAPTERIYSTRFVDDRLYMVTFRQVDPFFVIDLAEPTNPEELGELKIPGFSRYLHPYDENHIIGIGQDATELGRTTGLKISLFNVEDVSNPIEVTNFVTEERYAGSSALYEHKAFLFSKEKNMIVIPAYSWGHDGGDSYNGAFVFHIDEESIELRGLIDHASGERYFSQVERSLYINDLLYTKSPNLLRINRIDTLEAVEDIDLKEKIGIPIF